MLEQTNRTEGPATLNTEVIRAHLIVTQDVFKNRGQQAKLCQACDALGLKIEIRNSVVLVISAKKDALEKAFSCGIQEGPFIDPGTRPVMHKWNTRLSIPDSLKDFVSDCIFPDLTPS